MSTDSFSFDAGVRLGGLSSCKHIFSGVDSLRLVFCDCRGSVLWSVVAGIGFTSLLRDLSLSNWPWIFFGTSSLNDLGVLFFLNTGVYLRKNCRFLSVARPDPSTFTTYWLCCLTSTTWPVLSHFFGKLPIWFWILTRSPTLRGGICLVCSDQRSAAREPGEVLLPNSYPVRDTS